jgi:pyruvate dehydrogenase E1 component alpha subunit
VLQTNAVSVASFGDGATNIGTFHESVNLAAVWRLPVVFVCENNLYGEFTPVGDTCLVEDLAERAAAYGISGHVVDGNDVEAVRTVAADAIARARAGEGPSLIEAKTYRHRGHSRNDPARYRPDGELEAWLERDPLVRARDALTAAGAWSDESERELLAEIDAEIAAAVDAAAAAPFPDLTWSPTTSTPRWRPNRRHAARSRRACSATAKRCARGSRRRCAATRRWSSSARTSLLRAASSR